VTIGLPDVLITQIASEHAELVTNPCATRGRNTKQNDVVDEVPP